MSEHASKPKHRARAVEAMASHLCSTDFTDGFCGPRDGVCRGGNRGRYRNCMYVAEGLVGAMESKGMIVVWPYDKEPSTTCHVCLDRQRVLETYGD